MCRAERICKLSVYMKTGGCICSSASVHRSRVSYALLSAVSTFGSKKRRRDFQRGEPWFTSLAPCEARTAETAGSEKTNQTRKKLTIKGAQRQPQLFIIQYSLFIILPGPPLTPCRRHALQRTSGSSGQTRHAQTIPTTFNIIRRRGTIVNARTTERME